MHCTTFFKPPHDFRPTVHVAGCYCEYQQQILFVKRHPEKSQGNTWGVPGGKLEAGETAAIAVMREVYEEVGIQIASSSLHSIGILYKRLPHLDFTFHLFRSRFESCPPITLALEENIEAKWVSIEEARQLSLIAGGEEALNFYASGL